MASAAIRLAGVGKRYGATVALEDVSFEVAAGGVHALLGENGAGKSTLVRLLSGLDRPDTGTISIMGEAVRLDGPRRAQRLGLQTAFQELTLIRDLSVLENMLLPEPPRDRLGMVRRRRMRAVLREHFASLGIEIRLDAEVGTLDLATRQKVEIARAVWRRPRILLLDEPTSALSGRDVDWLGAVIARMAAAQVTVMFITHRLREVRDFCETLTVLRNGRHVATGAIAAYTDAQVLTMIVGRSLDHAFPARAASARAGGPVVAVNGLATTGRLRATSLELRAGEILGVAGLQGMGQLDLFLACFGLAETVAGDVQVDGRPAAILAPADAVRAAIGFGMVPEDRKSDGLLLGLSGRQNATLPVVRRFARGPLLDGQAEDRAVMRAFARLAVPSRATWTRAGAFSGGNQQKLAIAKWLVAGSRVLLLYDPTRGIDVGTKNEIYQLMRDFVAAGGAILFYSTELPELAYLADRVLVFYGGAVIEEIGPEQLARDGEDGIVRAMLGTERAAA